MIAKFIFAPLVAIVRGIAYVFHVVAMLTIATCAFAISVVAFAGGETIAGIAIVGGAIACVAFAFPRRRNRDKYVDNDTHDATMRAHGIDDA